MSFSKCRIFILPFVFFSLVCGSTWASGISANHAASFLLPDAMDSSHFPLDVSARKASSGDFEGAYRSLNRDSDSLRAGILASLCGMHRDALGLLQSRQGNAYLESYRLYYRSRSLLAEGRYGDALIELEKAIRSRSNLIDSGIRFHSRVREFSVEIISSSDSLLGARGLSIDTSDLSPRAHYLLAKAFLRIGNDSIGCAELKRSLTEVWPNEERNALSEAMSLCEKCYGRTTDRELRAIARVCISKGFCDEAMQILNYLNKKKGCEDAEMMLLRAQALSCQGKKVDALSLYNKIILSKSTTELIRREAIRNLALLTYSLGQYEEAIGLCNSYYRDNPDDPERYKMLALSGRIKVEQGKLAEAYDTFISLADAGTYEATKGSSIDYISAASALAFVLGRRDELNEKLSELARFFRSNGRGARSNNVAPVALLYWLWRSEASQSTMDSILSLMKSAYPHSHYTVAARGGLDSLISCRTGSLREIGVSRMLENEWSLMDSLHLEHGTGVSVAPSEAFEAYRYFVGCGLVPEAYECAETLLLSNSGEVRSLLLLYKEAIDHGLYRIAVRLVSTRSTSGLDFRMRERLSFPVAYPEIVHECAREGIAPELVLAVMREESMFDPQARSRAGAVGLMQLMPETVRWLARKYGWAIEHCRDLRDPSCSISLGSRYLSLLLQEFDCSLVEALAAYNGGKNRTSQWRERFARSYDPMVAKELIGLRETRFYVSKVLDSLCRYSEMAQ